MPTPRSSPTPWPGSTGSRGKMCFFSRGQTNTARRSKGRGDIYKGTYQGWYCVSDENFLAEDVPLQPEGDKICPDCGKRAVLVSEECYFFRLSAYQERLLKYYSENPQFVRPPS